MGPYERENFKTLLPHITFEFFLTSEFSSQCSSPKYCFEIVEILKIEILMFFFYFP